MASYIKPSRVFTGRDSYGRYVERALGVNGVWYARHNEQTQWGNQTTKWYVTEEPRFETECENAYSGEIIKHDPVCTWGWNRMGELENLPRLRLPVVEITENKE